MDGGDGVCDLPSGRARPGSGGQGGRERLRREGRPLIPEKARGPDPREDHAGAASRRNETEDTMPDFTQTTTEPLAYLYAEGTAPMADPDAIGAAMGDAFGKVMAAMGKAGLAADGPPMAVYHDYDPDTLRFRAGVPAAAGELARVAGDLPDGVATDTLPGGPAIAFTHVGPYATLREDYGQMMAYAEREGLTLGTPCCEIYIDDPSEVAPERLRTEVRMALA